MEIGDRIKAARSRQDMTLEDVAKKVGVSRQTICRYETGTIKSIPSSMIEKLSAALDVTPAYIMGWEDKKSPTIAEMAEQLNDSGKGKLMEYAEFLLTKPEYRI